MSKNVLIIGAGGQIPKILIPRLQKMDVNLTLFGRNAQNLPYKNVKKITGDAKKIADLMQVMQGQDFVYMNFDNKEITNVVIKAMYKCQVKRIIQAGVLGVYGEISEPFATWNERMLGWKKATNRGIEILEKSDLDYTYMRLTWLYNAKNTAYVASPKGEMCTGVQITRQAVAQFVIDNLSGKRNDIKASISLWEPGSENKPKPDFY